ncbi:MAG: SRPBCC domain-containing protein [Alphaproteobacteria bacterium]|nr:SRPBCC domain-containing protein [Alphaproteobacteria bacterium]
MIRLLVLSFALSLAAPAARAQGTTDCSSVEASGERTLCVEAVLPAPAAEIWALWSEPDQLRTWLAPVATVDLRPGGMMEAAYDASGHIGAPNNILNRVVSVEPLQSIVIQVARPPQGFPTEVRELATLIEFEPVSERETRVRVSMFGYREGQTFDDLYAFFALGNAYTLNKLRDRVVNGPTNWEAAQ